MQTAVSEFKTKEDVLKACTVDGLVVRLPGTKLDRKLYTDTAAALELIGGKWNRKHNGFLFQHEPTELLAQIATGVRRNLKKEIQFFATPAELAADMVRDAEIRPGHLIGEFQAGQGAIVNEILRFLRTRSLPNQVNICEIDERNRAILHKLYDGLDSVFFYPCEGHDFLNIKINRGEGFDRIIANPPFSRNQDIDHIYKMYEILNPGGRMVTMASTHWQYATNTKETKFKNWIYNVVDADVYRQAPGTFKESGTMIETLKLIIDKPF